MGALSPTHWLIIVGVLVLLFGAKRLPDAARSLGRSARILKSEVKELHPDDPETNSDTVAGTATAVAAPPAALPPVQARTGAEASIATNPVAATLGADTPTDHTSTGAAMNGHPGQ